MKPLSIIITTLNDFGETQATIRSIRETAGDRAEIIVIDDGSQVPLSLEDKGVNLIRNEDRAGVAASRHIGAIHASGDYLLLTDCHMRFEPGWYEKAMERIVGRDKTMHCAQCWGLSVANMDMAKVTQKYNGAYIHFYGPDAKNPAQMQVFEGKWMGEVAGDDYPLPCIMGATYFVPTEFFFHVNGLRLLRGWGSDEPFLSLKWWLSGGDIRMMKSVHLGHQFRDASTYRTESWNIDYNKMASIRTILPPDKAQRLIDLFPGHPELNLAKNKIIEDANAILTERAYYERIFVRTFDWYLKHFGLPFPS